MGGMIAQGDATQSVSQTRDATPNVLEVIAEQAGLFTGEDDDGKMMMDQSYLMVFQKTQ